MDARAENAQAEKDYSPSYCNHGRLNVVGQTKVLEEKRSQTWRRGLPIKADIEGTLPPLEIFETILPRRYLRTKEIQEGWEIAVNLLTSPSVTSLSGV